MKLITKIFLTSLVLFSVVFILYVFFAYIYVSDFIKKDASNNLIDLNKIQSDQIHTFVSMQRNQVVGISNNGYIRDYLNNPNNEIKKIVYQDLNKSLNSTNQLYELFVVDRLGKIVISTDTTKEGFDKSQDTLLIPNKNSNYVKGPYYSNTLGKLTYSISVPIKSTETEKILGNIVASFKIEVLNDLLANRTSLGKTGENFLLNEDLYFITPSKYFGSSVVLTKKIETQNYSDCFEEKYIVPNVKSYVDYRGVQILGAQTYIPDLNWCLISKIDFNEIYAPSNALVKTFSLVSFLAVVILLMFTLVFSSNLIKSIKEIYNCILALEEGEEKFPEISTRVDELGILTNSFYKLLKSIKQSRMATNELIYKQKKELKMHDDEMKLQQKALLNVLSDVKDEKNNSIKLSHDLKKFKLAVSQTSDQVVITDPDGIILYANAAVEKLTGFTCEEALGQKAGGPKLWGGLMSPEFYGSLWKTIKTDKMPFSGEVKNRHKNGTLYFAKTHISPVLDSNKSVVFFVGIERDVTHAKEIDKIKTEFVLMASDQLKTPLSETKGFLEILLKGETGELNPAQKDLITKVSLSNSHMIDLVSGLLNMSQPETVPEVEES